MKMKISLLFYLLVSYSFIFAQTALEKAIYFESDVFELNKEVRQSLEKWSETLKNAPDYNLIIEAHTDDQGSDDYNAKLAEKRAQSVQNYLTGLGIEVSKVSVRSYGENNPAYSNEEASGRQLNRRVDLNASLVTLSNLDEIFEEWNEQQTQLFEIDPTLNNKIIAQNGTTLYIPAQSFLDVNGQHPDGTVQLTISENYDMADMLRAELFTTSGERLLESGGMVRVEAFAGEEKLSLGADKSILLAMPTEIQLEGMQLFLGDENEEGRLQNWQVTGQDFKPDLELYLDIPRKPIRPRLISAYPKFVPDLSNKPVPPAKPRSPYQPHLPRQENIKYQPGFLKRLAMGKSKIAEITQAMYEKKMEEYHLKKEQFEKDVPEYQAAVREYQKQFSLYEEQLKRWNEGLFDQKANFKQSEYYQKIVNNQKEKHHEQLRIYDMLMEKWQLRKEEAVLDYESKFETGGRVDESSFNKYFFSINKLGWINCDRFYGVPQEEKMPK